MIDLRITQNWLEQSSDTALEECKSALVAMLNRLPEDRNIQGPRWSITKISEGNAAYLLYDEQTAGTLQIIENVLHVQINKDAPRQDDILYGIRYVASQLSLAVHSQNHNGARLPQDCRLSLDHSLFTRDRALRDFFAKSNYIPRYAPVGYEKLDQNRQALMIYAPYYAEHKHDGTVHIINNAMLSFLIQKENQQINKEFSYKVADSMDDFAQRYDVGLVPASFYQNFGRGTKIINQTYFDVFNIHRKVFVDPYVWNFNDGHDKRFYANTDNGLHLMDKVRKGETLDDALKRILREELKVANDYTGAQVWGLEFDRDREGALTPRLKINVFVRGLTRHQQSKNHDWVSLK